MSKQLYWYARDIEAYDRDTRHLTMLQHGAYTLLLDHYYRTKGKILRSQLNAIFKPANDDERAAIDFVDLEFFSHADGGPDRLFNKRADEEIGRAFEISDKRKAAVNKRWADVHANEDAKVIPPTPTPTPKTRSTTSASNVVTFDAEAVCFLGITPAQGKAWSEAFPAVDLNSEVAAAAVWLKANPKNRKSNNERFLVNWLKKAQDRAPRVAS